MNGKRARALRRLAHGDRQVEKVLKRAWSADQGQRAKFDAPRKRKHPQRDDLGAYTLVGRNPRRKWAAGISGFKG